MDWTTHDAAGHVPASLDRRRRDRELDALSSRAVVDLLVVGGGVTGAGVALDAVSRGMTVALVEAHDLAFGTSRWSSKLVHGGLRYLASGDVGLARESAAERDLLMRRVAPHLVRALPMLIPILPSTGLASAYGTAGALRAADLLRRLAGTPSSVLPAPRRLTAMEAGQTAPPLRRAGLRGGLLSWDGQLVDDARLVVGIARTAASRDAKILTRMRVRSLDGSGALATDTLTGATVELRARCVVNAAGVWAPELTPGVRLRPSRGTHLVVDAAAFGGLRTALTLPFPGERNRFALVLPQPDGRRIYVGLTDAAAETVEEVATPTGAEVQALIDVVSSALEVPLDRADVIGAFTGLRPLLDGAAGRTADLSRRHAVLTSANGVVTIVGGKLTTYRRMAADAVDTAVRAAGLSVGPSRTRSLALVGAAAAGELAGVAAPRRLVELYGTEAPAVLAEAAGDPELLEPVCDGSPVTGAELLFALRHEGALDVDDLLDRRSRIGLVPADRAQALPRAQALFDHYATHRTA